MDPKELGAGLQVTVVFSVTKNAETPNEDRWCVAEHGRAWAISDGASVSFDPGPWAEVLVHRYVNDPRIDVAWIQSAVAEYARSYDRDQMPWMQQASFDRGSFATLLGVDILPDNQGVRVTAIGDCLLAIVQGTRLVRTLPYTLAHEFDASPSLLSTNPAENGWLDDEMLRKVTCVLPAELEGAKLLLMTDALGRWVLNEPDGRRVAELLSLHDEEEFLSFVERERSAGLMRRDDTTLMVLEPR